jgi:hypothetical protein
MTQQQHPLSPCREGRILLASRALHEKRVTSQRKVSRLYSVPRTTLHRQLQGTQPKHETTSVNRKLSTTEEQSLVQWILDLDRRGFPPQVIDVRRMADALLAARGRNPPHQPLARTGCRASSTASQSSRQSGIGNPTLSARNVRILS